MKFSAASSVVRFLVLWAGGVASLTASASIVDVRIEFFDYAPNPVVIPAGTTVRFTNYDSSMHTATADDFSWDSGPLYENESWSTTFNLPGEFPYHCSPHPWMRATIIVVPGDEDVMPYTYSRIRGKIIGGGLASLFSSDDDRLSVRSGPVMMGSLDSPVMLEVFGNANATTGSSLEVTIESGADRAGLQQKTYLRNWNSGQWDLADTRALTTSDASFTITIPQANVSNYLRSDGELSVRVAAEASSFGLGRFWIVRIDRLTWKVKA